MKSIRRRLLGRLVFLLTALVAVFGAALFYSLDTMLVREFDHTTRAKAEALVTLIERQAAGALEFEFADEHMPEFSGGKSPEYFEIWLDNGGVFERSRSLGDRDLRRFAGDLNERRYRDVELPHGRAGRAVAIRFRPQMDVESRVEPAPEPPGAAAGPVIEIVVARGREQLDEILRLLAAAIVLSCALLPLGIALIVWMTVAGGLCPLSDVASAAAAIDAQRLDYQFPVGSMPRELRPICDRLNDLLGRLKEAFERERRFSRDVAHELRTPIAELKAIAEVALMDKPGAAKDELLLRDVLSIANQMGGLVAALLTLARCEAGLQAVPWEPVNLKEAWEQARGALNDAQSARVNVAAWPDGLWPMVQSNAAMLATIFANLLSNALAYSPEDSPVHIGCAAEGETIRISIANLNTGLTAEDLPRVFDPFWQKDPSRTDNEHCGLGLALVAALCRLLGIQIETRLEREQAVFVLVFAKDPSTNR